MYMSYKVKMFNWFLGIILVTVSGFSLAANQGNLPDRPKKQQTLGENTFKRLEKAQELMAEGMYDEARQTLDRILKTKGLNDYSLAITNQTYGFSYIQQSKFKEGITYFERAIAYDALPDVPQQQTIYNLASLYFGEDDFRKGVETLEVWFLREPDPKPSAYITLANGYAQLKELRKALVPARTAIEKSPVVKENWYNLLLSLHYQLTEYDKSAEVLETMVQYFPKRKKYWKQLSGMYMELKQDEKGLIVLELAYKQKLLDEAKEYLNLSNFYSYRNIPYKAAKVLDEGIKKGIVEDNEKHNEQLANNWVAAQEYDKAIVALEKAAKLSEESDLYVRLGQLYLEKEQWKKSISSFEAAAKKKDIKKPGQLALLTGMSYYELGQYKSARENFVTAQKFKDTKRQSSQWLTHLNGLLASTR